MRFDLPKTKRERSRRHPLGTGAFEERSRYARGYIVAQQVHRLFFNKRYDKVEKPPQFSEGQWEKLKVMRDRAEELGFPLRALRVMLRELYRDPGTPDWGESPKRGDPNAKSYQARVGDDPALVLMCRLPLGALLEWFGSLERKPL